MCDISSLRRIQLLVKYFFCRMWSDKIITNEPLELYMSKYFWRYFETIHTRSVWMLFINQRLKIRPPVLGSSQVMWDLWRRKRHCNGFSPSVSVYPCQVSFEQQFHSYQSSYHRRYTVWMLTASLNCQRKIAITWRYFEVTSNILELDEGYTEVIGFAIKDNNTSNILYL
jgi:hypothetical protein